jgi:hypothetical protein
MSNSWPPESAHARSATTSGYAGSNAFQNAAQAAIEPPGTDPYSNSSRPRKKPPPPRERRNPVFLEHFQQITELRDRISGPSAQALSLQDHQRILDALIHIIPKLADLDRQVRRIDQALEDYFERP